MPHVCIDDLLAAAEWLGCYENADTSDTNGDAMARVADYLLREADKRRGAAVVRQVARETGVAQSQVRAAIRAQAATLPRIEPCQLPRRT